MSKSNQFLLSSKITNFGDILSQRALLLPNKTAYTFLNNGETEGIRLTYQELEHQAQTIAALLQSRGLKGERVLLMYPPGLEFVTAFFGCLYAGVVAVPAYPPKRNQSIERIQIIIANAQAKAVLSTAALLKNLESRFEQNALGQSFHWLDTDNLDPNLAENWQKPDINEDSLAFLQYTSGSTGNPKGVMVSHNNLLVNSEDLDQGWNHQADSVIVTWLPTFHDMGLIYGVLQPIYKGIPCYMMAPVSFLQSPFRWLKAISLYRGTHTGAPNFAYDLCTRKITPEQRATLDLSSWKMALNGAEPVRADVLKRFTEMFEPCGFQASAFCPGYGLAEATLKVTSVRQSDSPKFYRVQTEALEENRVVKASEDEEKALTFVGCGKTEIDTRVLIVNPETLTPCACDEIGEIWVSGATVTQGYWNQPKATEQTFRAYLADTGEGPFLRTGDLGCVREDGELFVTGRLKDAIIIRGCNHYPQDIELTVEQSHPAIIPQRSAAFSVEVEGQEKLVIVAEVERQFHSRRQKSSVISVKEEGEKKYENKPEYLESNHLFDPFLVETTISNIKQAVTTKHGLQVHDVLLLRVGTIPRTSSGKIQRYACRQGFLESSRFNWNLQHRSS